MPRKKKTEQEITELPVEQSTEVVPIPRNPRAKKVEIVSDNQDSPQVETSAEDAEAVRERLNAAIRDLKERKDCKPVVGRMKPQWFHDAMAKYKAQGVDERRIKPISNGRTLILPLPRKPVENNEIVPEKEKVINKFNHIIYIMHEGRSSVAKSYIKSSVNAYLKSLGCIEDAKNLKRVEEMQLTNNDIGMIRQIISDNKNKAYIYCDAFYVTPHTKSTIEDHIFPKIITPSIIGFDEHNQKYRFGSGGAKRQNAWY